MSTFVCEVDVAKAGDEVYTVHSAARGRAFRLVAVAVFRAVESMLFCFACGCLLPKEDRNAIANN